MAKPGKYPNGLILHIDTLSRNMPHAIYALKTGILLIIVA